MSTLMRRRCFKKLKEVVLVEGERVEEERAPEDDVGDFFGVLERAAVGHHRGQE